ncbi:MAG: 30S ribosomal protein S6e [Desulfurococcaceae archaeon]
MVEFKVVISDPEAFKKPYSAKVKVVGEDLPYDADVKEGYKMPIARVGRALVEKLGAIHGVVTIRMYKPGTRERVNVRFKVEVDESIPENEVRVSSDLLMDKVGASEVEGEIFRARSWQIRLRDDAASKLVGLKIGDLIDGSIVGLKGYKLLITGGSDSSGFPMIPAIPGGVKKKVLLSSPPGFHPRERGERMRKTVRGNMITLETVQVNTKVVYSK